MDNLAWNVTALEHMVIALMLPLSQLSAHKIDLNLPFVPFACKQCQVKMGVLPPEEL